MARKYSTSIQFEEDKRDKVLEMAKKQKRSFSQMVQIIVSEYLMEKVG